MDTITIYTDGACRGNQNQNAPGGYGTIIVNSSDRLELSQGYADTTNNRMELRAVIAGLKTIETPSTIEIVSDSKYVTDAFNAGWIDGWLDRGWKNASGKPVKNRDLWEELLSLVEPHDIVWTWVKGHAGHPENERADELACLAADSGALLKDDGPTTVNVLDI
jgi:ribonuclease HI